MAGRLMPGIVSRSEIEFVVIFNPETPDRTRAIAGQGPSPLPWLRESSNLLQQLGASHLVFACNTAHHFLRRATPDELPLRVPLIDIVEEASAAVAAFGGRRVGLLATTGTVQAGLYQESLARRNVAVLLPSCERRPSASELLRPNGRVKSGVYLHFECLAGESLPDDALSALVERLADVLGEQEGLVMEAVYGVYGAKAGMTTGVAKQLALEAVRRLVARGAELIILGCTELPLLIPSADVPLAGRSVAALDPARVVAARLRETGGSHGIAGGLGPEATIDLQEKMDAPSDFTDLQREIFEATVEHLNAQRDQDHLKMIGIASRDPLDAARRLSRAGADFLVMTESAADVAGNAAAATRLPVLVAGAGRRIGLDVVRRAVGF